MKILAVDTSCDESCAAIVDSHGPRLLADVVHSHVSSMSRWGGIVPEIASREHLKALPLAVAEALDRAKLKVSDLDWIAVTNRPGLIGALLVGVSFGKALAFASRKPFSVVDHVEAHLYSPMLARLEGENAPPFPWIALVVSGGHTELVRVDGPLEHRWLGTTLDDAAGEAFDKIGKCLGMPYPAGPELDRLVKTSASPEDRSRYAFPRARLDGYDFSFSGLKTSVGLQAKKTGESDRLAIAASAQEAIVDALVDKVRLAQRQEGVEQVVVTGGVACNSRLREKLPGAYFPAPRHCSDNAAMIAMYALLQHETGKLAASPWSETASATRLDQR